MKPLVNQEWTSSEVEEARPIIAMLNNNYHIHDEAENNKNKKQDIVVESTHGLLGRLYKRLLSY
jgi:hypothetical protein